MIEAVWNVAKAAVLPFNLPFTVCLAASMSYWFLVLLGALDFELGGHDVDIHTDVHADADVHVDHDVGHGHDTHVDHDVHSPSALQAFLQFLHIGDTPMMVVLSVMALLAWMFAMLSNIYLNRDSSTLFALLLLIPNGIFTIFGTHLLLKPVAKFVRSLNEDAEKAPPMVGQIGEVTTSEVNHRFGMALVHIKGAPVAIQIRNTRGEKFTKGEKVLIIDENKQERTFEVVKYNQTELEA